MHATDFWGSHEPPSQLALIQAAVERLPTRATLCIASDNDEEGDRFTAIVRALTVETGKGRGSGQGRAKSSGCCGRKWRTTNGEDRLRRSVTERDSSGALGRTWIARPRSVIVERYPQFVGGQLVEDMIPLPKMLARLRSDLLAARAEGEGKELRFLVEDIELELQMATTQEKEGGIGIKFWVLNAEAKGKDSAVATQKLKLRLKAEQEVVDPDTGKRTTAPAKIGGKLPD